MARFYFKNRCVFKVFLHEIQDDFDTKILEIKKFLADELKIDADKLIMQLE